MTPGAHLAAAIGLLDEIDKGNAPADDIVAGYFRRHRFAGVKDRGAISEHIYAVLRHRASLDWWIEACGHGLAPDARHRTLAALVLTRKWRPAELEKAFDGDRFRPAPLTEEERRLIQELGGHDLSHPEMPAQVKGNYPAWLTPFFERSFGPTLDREIDAMNKPAPLDLRVNLLKCDRETGKERLQRDGVDATETALSPLGLRVWRRIPLATLASFKEGLIEVQDEGSQIAALLADARPGMRVVDFCAGAGGKTLTLAATMKNRGHLMACDISERRLERATQRLRRAGASIVQRRHLTSQRDKWVKHHAGSFDRVFVDAPCSGTGTWRRNPDAKWRLTPDDVTELVALQAEILDSAQRLVRPHGRLIYATCSLLREENEDQIEYFLSHHEDFALLPMDRIWHETIGPECPFSGETLRLSPERNGTDGFFVAILECLRQPEVAKASDERPISTPDNTGTTP